MTYHYFRLKGIKSLNSKIDEKAQDYKENINQILRITDGCSIDELDDKNMEAAVNLIKTVEDMTYLKFYNITYYSMMGVIAFVLALVTSITIGICGFKLIPILNVLITLELIICFYELYVGVKERKITNK